MPAKGNKAKAKGKKAKTKAVIYPRGPEDWSKLRKRLLQSEPSIVAQWNLYTREAISYVHMPSAELDHEVFHRPLAFLFQGVVRFSWPNVYTRRSNAVFDMYVRTYVHSSCC